jgi:hypothetical protein
MAQQTIEFDPAKMRDLSIPMERVVIVGSLLSIVLLIASLIPYIAIWREFPALVHNDSDIVWLLIGLVALIMIHEGTHAVGWLLFGGIKSQDIRFGIDRKTLSPYAHAKVPMPVSGYRVGVILPLIITGILPLIIAVATHNGTLTWLSAYAISAAIGDLIVLWVIRTLPGHSRVIDHPKQAGCYVMMD